MSGSEKDRLAALGIEQHCAFEQALAVSRKRCPTRQFRSFAAIMRWYVDATREDKMLHRDVVRAVNGLVEYLQSERKRVPGEVLLEAESWNACSSSATIRTSAAMSPLVCDLACWLTGKSYFSVRGRALLYGGQDVRLRLGDVTTSSVAAAPF